MIAAVMERRARLAQQQRVPLLFVLIPHAINATERHESGRIDVARYPGYRRSRATDELVAIAQRLERQYVDLFPAFRAQGADALYFQGYDDHWNDAGQALAAEVVAKAIVADALLPPGSERGAAMSAASHVPERPEAELWDVVIVGAGMGGATLGHELARRGRRLLFLEKGKLLHRDPTTDYTPVRVGPKRAMPEERLRRGWFPVPLSGETNFGSVELFAPLGCGTGGSTAVFAAALEHFHPMDFRPRANFPDENDSTLPEAWPISYDELAPYYQRAEALFRVRGSPDPLHPSGDTGLLTPPAANPRDEVLVASLEAEGLHPYRIHVGRRYVPGCDECPAGACARDCKSDAGSVCVLPALDRFGANILAEREVLALGSNGPAVDAVRCRWQGRELRIRAKIVALAAGGFMTPVLLLNSRSRAWPDGLANRSGLVGRNLMIHASDFVALRPPRREPSRGASKTIALNDFYFTDGRKLGTFQSVGVDLSPWRIRSFLGDQCERDPAFWHRLVRPFLKPVSLASMLYFNNAAIFASIVEDPPHRRNRVVPDPSTPSGMRLRVPVHRRTARARALVPAPSRRGAAADPDLRALDRQQHQLRPRVRHVPLRRRSRNQCARPQQPRARRGQPLRRGLVVLSVEQWQWHQPQPHDQRQFHARRGGDRPAHRVSGRREEQQMGDVFVGRTVILTGAGSGVGRGLAIGFARDGANVVAIGRTERDLEETAAQCAGSMSLVVGDVRLEADVERLFAEAERRHGRVDVLVNNAAVYPRHSVLESPVEEFARTLEINVVGAFLCCRCALPSMLARGHGRIVNLGSLAWKQPIPNSAAYSASKGGDRPLTRAIAAEIARSRHPDVLVNELLAGIFHTRMSETGEDPMAAYPHARTVVALPAGGPHGETFLRSEIFVEKPPGLRAPARPAAGAPMRVAAMSSPEGVA